MNDRKIYIVAGGWQYANWMQGQVVHNIQAADLVLFTGGEDVSPAIYNRKPHPTTSANWVRDQYEFDIFNEAVELKKKMIGICRGSQFLCACSGGILVQDQPNPDFIHPMETYDGKSLLVTSTHHQAQFPWVLPDGHYQVLGWTKGLSRYHYGENNNQELIIGKNAKARDREVEICHYKKTNALGIQSHPEMIYENMDKFDPGSDTIDYLQDLLNKFMEDKL